MKKTTAYARKRAHRTHVVRTYDHWSELAASPTEPLPLEKVEHQLTRMWEGLAAIEKALIAVKLIAGHFEPAIHPQTGELIQVPKSIAYESMDQDEFDTFYSAALDGVLQHILPTMDAGTANRLMDMIVEGWA